MMIYLIIFALLVVAELVYFRIADRYNIIDKPNERSSHSSVVLRGRVMEEFYDDAGTCYERVEVAPCGSVCALNIPAGTWHTLISLESGTVILEVKDGAYEPILEEDIMNCLK